MAQLPGLDLLFLEKFLQIAMNEFPAGWAAGNFYVVDDKQKLNALTKGAAAMSQLLATGRVARHRGHGLWTNHTYNPARDDRRILAGFNAARDMKQKFPHVGIQYSAICEHALKGAALARVIEPLLRQADGSGIQIVNSFSSGGDFFNDPRVINETHGSKSHALRGVYNYSDDGQSCTDFDCEDSKRKHAAADTYYYWIASFNGKLNDADSKAIAERRAYPFGNHGSLLFDSVIYLNRPRGGAVWLPSTNHDGDPLPGVPVKKQWLYKSHADQHASPEAEARAHVGLFIIPVRQRVELVADNGQVVAVSGTPQSFIDGRWRTYFGQFGFQMGEKARRIQGHPILKVRVGGNIMGQLNPAHRLGVSH